MDIPGSVLLTAACSFPLTALGDVKTAVLKVTSDTQRSTFAVNTDNKHLRSWSRNSNAPRSSGRWKHNFWSRGILHGVFRSQMGESVLQGRDRRGEFAFLDFLKFSRNKDGFSIKAPPSLLCINDIIYDGVERTTGGSRTQPDMK
jgi:hypothetical protein